MPIKELIPPDPVTRLAYEITYPPNWIPKPGEKIANQSGKWCTANSYNHLPVIRGPENLAVYIAQEDLPKGWESIQHGTQVTYTRVAPKNEGVSHPTPWPNAEKIQIT